MKERSNFTPSIPHLKLQWQHPMCNWAHTDHFANNSKRLSLYKNEIKLPKARHYRKYFSENQEVNELFNHTDRASLTSLLFSVIFKAPSYAYSLGEVSSHILA